MKRKNREPFKRYMWSLASVLGAVALFAGAAALGAFSVGHITVFSAVALILSAVLLALTGIRHDTIKAMWRATKG